MGVWIETGRYDDVGMPICVTPCVGVWIETLLIVTLVHALPSHPAWVCGLKRYFSTQVRKGKTGHTLRGCVD